MAHTDTLPIESAPGSDSAPEVTLDDLARTLQRLSDSIKPASGYTDDIHVGRDGRVVETEVADLERDVTSAGLGGRLATSEAGTQTFRDDGRVTQISRPAYRQRPLPPEHLAAAKRTFARVLLGDPSPRETTPAITASSQGRNRSDFVDFMPALRAATSDARVDTGLPQQPVLEEAGSAAFVRALVEQGARVRRINDNSATSGSLAATPSNIAYDNRSLAAIYGPMRNSGGDPAIRSAGEAYWNEDDAPAHQRLGTLWHSLGAEQTFGAAPSGANASGSPRLGAMTATRSPQTAGAHSSSALEGMTIEDKEAADSENQINILDFISELELAWSQLRSSYPGVRPADLRNRMYQRADAMVGLGHHSDPTERAISQAARNAQHDIRAMLPSESEIRRADRLVQGELGLTLNHLVELCLKSVEGRPMNGLSVETVLYSYLDWIGVKIPETPYTHSTDAVFSNMFPGRQKVSTNGGSLRDRVETFLLDSDTAVRARELWTRSAASVRRFIATRFADTNGHDVAYRAPRFSQPTSSGANNYDLRQNTPANLPLSAAHRSAGSTTHTEDAQGRIDEQLDSTVGKQRRRRPPIDSTYLKSITSSVEAGETSDERNKRNWMLD